MGKYSGRSYGNDWYFFSVEALEDLENGLNREIGPIARKWERYHKHHKGSFPREFTDFLLRDILHYTTHEIDRLTIEEYYLAELYAEMTYLRRDVVYAMSGDTNEKGIFEIEQPGIDKWVEEQYENVRKNNKV